MLLVLLHSGQWLQLLKAQTAVNLAVFVEGRVSVKREGWTHYAPVVFGTDLRFGDLLRLEGASRMTVVCSDLTKQDISAAIAGVPCASTGRLLQRPDGSKINPSRGPAGLSPGLSPVIVWPRNTKLLSPNPLLRWTPVEGATAYTVTVRGPHLNWSIQVNSAAEIVYPQDAPPLQPGVDYKLIVQANGRSSAEHRPFQGFSILGSEDRRTVDNQAKLIKALDLPPGPAKFVTAHVYVTYGLNAEAIQGLEGISETFKRSAVTRLLGDLYLSVGLARDAETRYLAALALSNNEHDEEGQLVAHVRLAHIYDIELGNTNLAIRHLSIALSLAHTIGDGQTAIRVEQKQRELRDLR